MQTRGRVPSTQLFTLVVALGLVSILGCGPSGPKTYPITGKLRVGSRDVGQLAGHHIEAALSSDPTVRASGEIRADGSFTLQTLHEGTILKGALPGTYWVRIVLADDDKASQRRAFGLVGRRPLHFRTSGLSLQVPAGGDISLELGKP